MQPYPTYQNYLYNPYLTNYQAQQPQVQQMPQMNQTYGNSLNSNLSGKWVTDFNEVLANDVTMDKPCVFVKGDKSEIQIKNWDSSGRIVTTSYFPQMEVAIEEKTNKPEFNAKADVLDPLFERIAVLEEKIDKLSKPTRTGTAKKEANDE